MAEIGNDVSKRIYEANVHEVIAPRATPDCSKGQEISKGNVGAFNFLKKTLKKFPNFCPTAKLLLRSKVIRHHFYSYSEKATQFKKSST